MPPLEDETLTADAPAPEPSIRDALASALQEASGPEPQTPASADPAQAATAAQAAADQRARDEQGRFAPKPAEAAAAQPKISPEPKTPQTTDAPPQQATSGPPSSWSATAKSDWSKFVQTFPHLAQEVQKREGDITNGKAQWDQKAERLNRLDTVLSPRSERFRLAGIDEAQAVNALFAAQDYLERDPLNGLAYLARQYGVDFRQFAQRMAGGQQPPQGQAQLPPQVMQLAEKVSTLENALAQQRQSAEQSTREHYLGQVQAFAQDPANLYFENVKGKMGSLLRSGEATDLSDAYQQAIWAHPEIRPLLVREQEERRVAEAQQAARAKATQARHASGSVTGSPAPGSTPGAAGPAPSLRDELQRAFDAA